MCRAVKGLCDSSACHSSHLDPHSIPLCATNLVNAEWIVVRWSQMLSFHTEITVLTEENGCLPKSSYLAPLNPILKDGLLRVGGRIQRAPVSDEVKFPIILSLDSPVSSLLMKTMHERTGHGGKDQVLSRLQEKFWVIQGGTVAHRVLRSCVFCRCHFSCPWQQMMADLPSDLIDPEQPPFTNTGIDYFGPILVKRGRSQVKRYGALFTCLTCRAVLIEMAESLTRDAFINVLRCFIACGGQVKMIRSDNGSSFIGAEKELRQAIQEWNQSQIESFLLQQGITCLFNAPGASHHGGAWERRIRTTQRIMVGLAREQMLTDDGLTTLFAEAESVLNGRPLTRCSSDPNDFTCLTPNHLLLLKDQQSLPPGIFTNDNNYVCRRWCQVQYLSSLFSKRWLREYLTLLQVRQKWLLPKWSVQVGDLVLVVDQNALRGLGCSVRLITMGVWGMHWLEPNPQSWCARYLN